MLHCPNVALYQCTVPDVALSQCYTVPMLHCPNVACPDVILSRCYTVPMLHCPNITLSRCCAVPMLRCPGVTLSQCYTVLMLRCPNATLSQCCTVPILHCPDVALSQCYTVPMCHCPNATLSRCYTVPMLRCPNIALSRCYTVPMLCCPDVILSRCCRFFADYRVKVRDIYFLNPALYRKQFNVSNNQNTTAYTLDSGIIIKFQVVVTPGEDPSKLEGSPSLSLSLSPTILDIFIKSILLGKIKEVTERGQLSPTIHLTKHFYRWYAVEGVSLLL